MEEKLDQLSYLHSALVGLGIMAFYYFFVYSVSNSSALIEGLESRVYSTNLEIKKVDALIREKQELDAELIKNEELFKSSSAIFTEEFNQDVALEKLTTKARSYGLAIESIGNFSQWAPDEQFLKSKLSLVLKGTYSKMMFFLSDFTREKSFYSFQELSLAPISGAQASRVDQSLSIGLDIVILKLMSKEEREKLRTEGFL